MHGAADSSRLVFGLVRRGNKGFERGTAQHTDRPRALRRNSNGTATATATEQRPRRQRNSDRDGSDSVARGQCGCAGTAVRRIEILEREHGGTSTHRKNRAAI